MANRDGNEFTRKIKAQAWARTKFYVNDREVHLCDGCQCELVSGQVTYDHIKTCEEGGTGTLANCQVLCRTCDQVKTYGQDIPRIRKGDRQRDRHSGALGGRPTSLSGPPRHEINALKEERSRLRRGDRMDLPERRMPDGFESASSWSRDLRPSVPALRKGTP